MSAGEVVGAGWHDLVFRWDISTPQAVTARLEALPGQGSLLRPGKKLYAERNRFGKKLLARPSLGLGRVDHTALAGGGPAEGARPAGARAWPQLR